MDSEQDTLIELKSVTVHAQEHISLDEASASFPANRSTVIMGPSGSGKSMLLKVAAAIIPPDSGRVLLNGKNLQRLSQRELLEFRRSSGFMFQDAALWENKTIYENLALPIQFHFPHRGAEEIKQRIRELLEPMNLLDSLTLRPAALSAGEQKIVSFLRAIVLEPAILFLDEPTPSIDHQLLEKMLRTIRELKERGCTIIAVTHDAHLTAMIANHLVVLKDGRVLAAAAAAEVRRSASREVIDILSRVLSEAATYDTDILDLLQE
ncbi:MAG: ATP-binding cassette domain-containing protein [Spirochaetaceae bacterium]|nr:MAG: ATP-binding cassette domain-containing protein [Spirochaetaceae bacterium]